MQRWLAALPVDLIRSRLCLGRALAAVVAGDVEVIGLQLDAAERAPAGHIWPDAISRVARGGRVLPASCDGRGSRR